MSRRCRHDVPGQYSLNFYGEESDLTTEEEPLPDLREKAINFISFGSGSSGNCCYIGTSEGGLVIDAGVAVDKVEKILAANGVKMSHVKGLLLTHDHSDHTRYAYTMVRTYRHMRLFCTPRVLNGLLRRHNISKRIKEYHESIFKEIPFRLAGFGITAFDVPHDGTDNMGFSISYSGRNFVVATDLGSINERADHYMRQADYLVIESNYDADMLEHGRYPEYLKARIRTANGHMDNVATAAYLRQLATKRLREVWLCHLSQDNNTPELALDASRRALAAAGLTVGGPDDTLFDRQADVRLAALPRFEPTRWYVLRP